MVHEEVSEEFSCDLYVFYVFLHKQKTSFQNDQVINEAH